VRVVVKELSGAVHEQAALARLPPGLAGARAGAAAATLAISKQRGLVGSTEVQRSALDARSELTKEVLDGALAHKRFKGLVLNGGVNQEKAGGMSRVCQSPGDGAAHVAGANDHDGRRLR
jgi:hypothetical protein